MSKHRAENSQPPPEFPGKGRLMGVDFGQKRVGLALSNPDQTLATPLETLMRRDEKQDARRLKQIARDYQVVGLVVGLPVHMSGKEGAQARAARAFGQWVAQETALPVCFHDERYTSAFADELLRELDLTARQRQDRRDRLAAQILLQSYLDGRRGEHAPQPLS
ncbi:MAG: Holliday junction resolvase RuvX [Planctomycetaceae bacterium]